MDMNRHAPVSGARLFGHALSVAVKGKKAFLSIEVGCGTLANNQANFVSCERLSRWTEANGEHGFSKDPTVPTRVLKKTNTKPSLVQTRRSPAGSGHFGIVGMTNSQPTTLLPTL